MNYLTPEQLQQLQELEKLKKIVMRKVLTKEAVERLGRIRMVKPELATQLELYLVQLYQSGQIKSVINDTQLKKILDSITQSPKFKIIK
ncbi:MAG: DNA-binding protein [Candidatus Aenigmarchaeota archaeon]|nr:DNA-binding protein [Candidatus Aenigmarchaeota archaeon]